MKVLDCNGNEIKEGDLIIFYGLEDMFKYQGTVEVIDYMTNSVMVLDKKGIAHTRPSKDVSIVELEKL